MIYNTENINQTKRVVILVLSVIFYISENKPYYVHPTGGWTYYFYFLRQPSAIRTLGFRSFEGKVFILSLPNLVWVFIGLIACMGLLLVKIGL